MIRVNMEDRGNGEALSTFLVRKFSVPVNAAEVVANKQ